MVEDPEACGMRIQGGIEHGHRRLKSNAHVNKLLYALLNGQHLIEHGTALTTEQPSTWQSKSCCRHASDLCNVENSSLPFFFASDSLRSTIIRVV